MEKVSLSKKNRNFLAYFQKHKIAVFVFSFLALLLFSFWEAQKQLSLKQFQINQALWNPISAQDYAFFHFEPTKNSLNDPFLPLSAQAHKLKRLSYKAHMTPNDPKPQWIPLPNQKDLKRVVKARDMTLLSLEILPQTLKDGNYFLKTDYLEPYDCYSRPKPAWLSLNEPPSTWWKQVGPHKIFVGKNSAEIQQEDHLLEYFSSDLKEMTIYGALTPDNEIIPYYIETQSPERIQEHLLALAQQQRFFIHSLLIFQVITLILIGCRETILAPQQCVQYRLMTRRYYIFEILGLVIIFLLPQNLANALVVCCLLFIYSILSYWSGLASKILSAQRINLYA